MSRSTRYVVVSSDSAGRILLARRLTDKSQAYYWTEEWQKRERQADEDKKAGRCETFDSVDDLIADLEQRAVGGVSAAEETS